MSCRLAPILTVMTIEQQTCSRTVSICVLQRFCMLLTPPLEDDPLPDKDINNPLCNASLADTTTSDPAMDDKQRLRSLTVNDGGRTLSKGTKARLTRLLASECLALSPIQHTVQL
jgi:hypothetical protein